MQLLNCGINGLIRLAFWLPRPPLSTVELYLDNLLVPEHVEYATLYLCMRLGVDKSENHLFTLFN